MSGLLRRYRAERLPWAMTSIVPLLLAVCAQAGARSNPTTFVVDVVLASLLFAQFRIFDDLADCPRDARTHPGRVLVRTRTVRPIVIAGFILAAATVGILLLRRAVCWIRRSCQPLGERDRRLPGPDWPFVLLVQPARQANPRRGSPSAHEVSGFRLDYRDIARDVSGAGSWGGDCAARLVDARGVSRRLCLRSAPR